MNRQALSLTAALAAATLAGCEKKVAHAWDGLDPEERICRYESSDADVGQSKLAGALTNIFLSMAGAVSPPVYVRSDPRNSTVMLGVYKGDDKTVDLAKDVTDVDQFDISTKDITQAPDSGKAYRLDGQAYTVHQTSTVNISSTMISAERRTLTTWDYSGKPIPDGDDHPANGASRLWLDLKTNRLTLQGAAAGGSGNLVFRCLKPADDYAAQHPQTAEAPAASDGATQTADNVNAPTTNASSSSPPTQNGPSQ